MMSDQPAEPKRPAPKKAPREARPVHMLVQSAASENSEQLLNFEVFTAELAARRALDDREDGWRYVLVYPGQSFRDARAAQQGTLP